jgi:hypothetical protein
LLFDHPPSLPFFSLCSLFLLCFLLFLCFIILSQFC